MEAHERQAILYTSSAHALVHVIELTFAAVLVLVGLEFGLGLVALGLIANALAITFGAGALPAGFLADRVGSRRMLVTTMVGAAVCSLLVALSTNTAMLAVTLTALGLAIGFYHPSGLSLIARVVQKRALGMGYHGMAGNLGVALTPFFAAGVAQWWGWRGPYFILAGLALALAVATYLAPFREGGRQEAATTPLVDSAATQWHQLLGPLLLLYVATMMGGFIYRGTLTFLPAHFQQNVQLRIGGLEGVALAGSLATVALLFGVAGQYIGGNLAQKYRRETLVLLLTLALLPTLLLMGTTRGLPLVAAAAAFALFNFMAQPAWNTLVAEYTPAQLQGRSYGLSFFAAFGLGSFAAGFSGVVAARLGIQWVFVVMGGFAFLVALLALVLLLRALGRRPAAPVVAPAPRGGPGAGYP
ncbi:MAG: MFS transporter [Dehalococcoidia bacterium]|nr:MFS transporter [Dehalococcoidia bacterium]